MITHSIGCSFIYLIHNGREYAGEGRYQEANEGTGRISLSAFERMAALSRAAGSTEYTASEARTGDDGNVSDSS
jgi:hypothetical protein